MRFDRFSRLLLVLVLACTNGGAASAEQAQLAGSREVVLKNGQRFQAAALSRRPGLVLILTADRAYYSVAEEHVLSPPLDTIASTEARAPASSSEPSRADSRKPSSASAELSGYVELSATGYPVADLAEARSRIFVRYNAQIREKWRVVASGYAYGVTGSGGRESAAILKGYETYIERLGNRLELRLGYTNIVWGVLDEFQPTDVVNPLDVARFVQEGRAEARLPSPLARLRVFFPGELIADAIFVPVAPRGTFDQLAAASSPFAPEGLEALPRSESPGGLRQAELGLRLQGTHAATDWSASFFRDVVDFDRYEIRLARPLLLTATRPARWMLGGDLETARGDWVLRGEGAVFLRDPVQLTAPLRIERTWSAQVGAGADRRLGEGSFLLEALYSRVAGQDDIVQDTDEITVVGGITRDFARGTRNARVFGAWNAFSRSTFLRAILGAELRENLRGELSGGAFIGDGGPPLGLIQDADFLLVRIRVYF